MVRVTASSAPYNSKRLGYFPNSAEFAPKVIKLYDGGNGMTISELAARFSLSYLTIWRILGGKAKKQKAEPKDVGRAGRDRQAVSV